MKGGFMFLALMVTGLYSCKKEGKLGKEGQPGLQSLIRVEALSAGVACPAGGIIVYTGIDQNRNGVLEETEVNSSVPVCNGQSSSLDKQIILPLNFPANVSNTTPVVGGDLIKFNKHYYTGVDSITLIGNPYVGQATNTAKVELYNLTDGEVIANSLISSNSLYNDRIYHESGNLYNNLPDKEIHLGIRLQGTENGQFAASGSCFLVLYRH